MQEPDDRDPVGSSLCWQQRSQCRSVSSDLFFPDSTDPTDPRTESAKALCRSCRVSTECLRHALINREQFGIWGGLTEAERRYARLPKQHYWRRWT